LAADGAWIGLELAWSGGLGSAWSWPGGRPGRGAATWAAILASALGLDVPFSPLLSPFLPLA